MEQVSFKSGMEERGILEEVMDGVIMVSAIPPVSYTHLTLPTIYSV